MSKAYFPMAPPLQQPQNQLQLPTAPNFPLSSPITEEVPSPTSTSSSDRGRDHYLERNRPFHFLAKMASATPPYPIDMDMDEEKQSSRAGTGTGTGTSTRNGPVGLNLNLVTDFSRPAPNPTAKARTEVEAAQPPPFVDLNDLKVLSKVREKERERGSVQTQTHTHTLRGILKKGTTTSTHKFQRLPDGGDDNAHDKAHDDDEPIQPQPQTQTQSKRRSAWYDLKPRVSPRRKYKDDLSPSDRPIMIGFSMPYNNGGELETQSQSQSQSQSHRDKDRPLDSAGSSQPPLTPSIIVTPAKEGDFWPDFSQIHHFPRATSSIYSQPTPYLEQGGGGVSGIPPVPAIPPLHTGFKSEVTTPIYASSQSQSQSPSKRQSVANSTRKLRAYSTGTVFEDDDINDNEHETWRATTTRSRSYSSDSTKRAFDFRRSRLSTFGNGNRSRVSIASESTRPVSQGWWTYLLSPLLKTPTTTTDPKRSPLLAGAAPTPTTTRSGMSDEWWEKEVSCFSPDTPETAHPTSAGVSRGELASWQNVNTNPFADRSASASSWEEAGMETETETPVAKAGGMSFGFGFGFGGKPIPGAAAEYYQACAHELFSKTPYFECVNHVCSITPVDRIAAAGGGGGPGDADAGATRGILVDVDEAHPTPSVSGSRGIPAEVASSKGLISSPPVPVPVSVPPADSDTKKSVEGSVEESVKEGPPPVVDEKGESEKPPLTAPIEPQGEKQAQAPFPFLLPNGIPPNTQVYFQSAPGPSPAPMPMASTDRSVPHYIVVQPPNYAPQAQAQAPVPTQAPPTSPGLQRATEQTGAVPLSDMHPAPAYTAHDNSDAALPPRMDPLPITREAIDPSSERSRIEAHRCRLEKEDRVGRKAGGLWRGRGCIPNKGCFGRPGREGRLRRRWYVAIALFFLAIVVTAILLAILLTRRGDETPVQSAWLNLTGYPPMPTGIATIAGPEAKVQNSGCITPSTLWSCALPREQQEANKPYAANQPNFRVEIRFRNGTYPNSTTVASKVTARGVNELFSPEPEPPGTQEQAFLGNTTDGNTAPYEGEVTPFYMALLSPVKTSSLVRRAASDTDSDKNSNAFPDIEDLIPSPDRASDGTAASATLYPLPSSQPIRLYNRGQDNEHYGFYTYFDRSIFLDSTAPLTGGTTDESKADANGGPSKENARVRCTWSQTRFLVQIWTRSSRLGMSLLGRDSPTATSTASSSRTESASGAESAGSSANDFSRPGSFPYPITITMDRHGGTAKAKMVYCYGMESAQRINTTEKKLQVEDRGFGGSLVNAAPGIFNLTVQDDSAGVLGDYGGVDGGIGGCSCQWGNWISSR